MNIVRRLDEEGFFIGFKIYFEANPFIEKQKLHDGGSGGSGGSSLSVSRSVSLLFCLLRLTEYHCKSLFF